MCKEGFRLDPVMGCKSCEKGTYSEEPDSESCTPCPEGQTTFSQRSTSADACHGKKRNILEIRLTFWDLRHM